LLSFSVGNHGLSPALKGRPPVSPDTSARQPVGFSTRAILISHALLGAALAVALSLHPSMARADAALDVLGALRKQRLDVHHLVSDAAARAGIPACVAHGLVRTESAYRPHTVGRAGEIGLTQIKLATARGVGFRGSRALLFDPRTNLTFGFRYARQALRKGSIGFYQSGMAGRPSRAYVVRVMRACH
jgi:soluble lytic murein transglycosylase-like protein